MEARNDRWRNKAQVTAQGFEKGAKRQMIYSSLESSDQTADIVHICTPAITKSTKPTSLPEQPAWAATGTTAATLPTCYGKIQLSPPQLHSQPPDHDKPYPYTFLPGYQRIRSDLPTDVDIRKNPHYHIIMQAATLLEYAPQRHPIKGN